MAALPYIQLDVGNYLSDTMHLKPEEHGAYLLLTMNFWSKERPIPRDRAQIIANASDDEWARIKHIITEFFQETDLGLIPRIKHAEGRWT